MTYLYTLVCTKHPPFRMLLTVEVAEAKAAAVALAVVFGVVLCTTCPAQLRTTATTTTTYNGKEKATHWQETFALQFFVSRNATFFRLVMKQDVHLQMLQQNVVFLHCNICFPALQHLVSCIATFGFLHCNIWFPALQHSFSCIATTSFSCNNANGCLCLFWALMFSLKRFHSFS
jgi:hypothetical protein